MRWFGNLWRQQPGIVLAILFSVWNGGLTAVLITDPYWSLVVGVGSFVLVSGAYLTTEWITTRPEPPELTGTEAPIETASAYDTAESPPPTVDKQVAVLFVHGILSSANTWTCFERLMRDDADLEAVQLETFEYRTALFRGRPDRRIPELETIALRLKTRFEQLERSYRGIVIVSHSMGGLVTQRFVTLMLEAGEGKRLPRIKRIIMFACPTAGADFLRIIRRLVPLRHAQEQILRPLNAEITRIQQMMLSAVVHATGTTERTCPIPLSLYAGESDNIVLPQSALGVYPARCTGVVAGDHFSIIRPDSSDHESYSELKTHLKEVLAQLDG